MAPPLTNRTAPAKVLAVEVRRRLKADFPGCTFSVRSERYSLGSGVHVRWAAGPAVWRVRACLGPLFPDDNRHAPSLNLSRGTPLPARGASVLIDGVIGLVTDVDDFRVTVQTADGGQIDGLLRNCEVLS